MRSSPNQCSRWSKKHFLEHSKHAMSNIDRLFEVLLILRGQLVDVGRLLCLYAPGMPFRKAVPGLLRWQDVVSAAVRVCWSRRGWGCLESLAARREEARLSLGYRWGAQLAYGNHFWATRIHQNSCASVSGGRLRPSRSPTMLPACK
jgi:hypothetical protein